MFVTQLRASSNSVPNSVRFPKVQTGLSSITKFEVKKSFSFSLSRNVISNLNNTKQEFGFILQFDYRICYAQSVQLSCERYRKATAAERNAAATRATSTMSAECTRSCGAPCNMRHATCTLLHAPCAMDQATCTTLHALCSI